MSIKFHHARVSEASSKLVKLQAKDISFEIERTLNDLVKDTAENHTEYLKEAIANVAKNLTI